ncbi:MAG TPA: MBL fold metallo-hydrolase [Actinomycetota bacterium]|nr:MBL fold metallo-hydrolase [Actinomycetota bacterium]
MGDQRIVEGYTLGVFASNTYIAAAKAGDAAVVIDPGQDAAPLIKERLAAHGLTLQSVLLTHGHLDHIWSAADVADAAGVPAYIHPGDRYMLNDPGAALGRMGMGKMEITTPADVRDLSDGDRFTFGDLVLETRHTPGHTPGHCVFLTNGILFSGDLIFQGSIGRTDFPGGSLEDLMESIKRVVLPLDDDVMILSGHGPETTVGIERRTNPFVLADARGELPQLLGL